MQVRDAADYRTLFWAFVLFPLVPAIEYTRPGWGIFLPLLPVTLYLSFTSGVFVHNHNHRAVFTGKKAVLGAMVPRFRTRQIGEPPWRVPASSR
jgi:hypothetical protein